MSILYNCHHSGDQYRITKFDEDMNPQGSYLTTLDECNCPAGVRPTCRHRQMLPKFLARNHVGDEWFFDFDRGGWVQLGEEWKQQEGFAIEGLETDPAQEDQVFGTGPAITQGALEPQLTGLQEEQILMGFHNPPEGVTMIVLDSPEKVVDVHNAIADAVGEPPAPAKFPRRL